MDRAAALKLIRDCAAAGHYWFTDHALDRMLERQITANEVVDGMRNAPSCDWDPGNASWIVPAVDVDGISFEIAVVFDAAAVYVKAVVKTVF